MHGRQPTADARWSKYASYELLNSPKTLRTRLRTLVVPPPLHRPDADALPSQAVAILIPDVEMHPVGGRSRTLAEQLKLFHLAAVVLDPFTYESSWLLETAGRILSTFSGADCRTAMILTCDAAGATEFVGPWADKLMIFADPDREFTKAVGLAELPAFIHIAMDLSIVGKAEGWDPETWRPIAENLADMMSWSRPQIPVAGDPVPFEGTPALV